MFCCSHLNKQTKITKQNKEIKKKKKKSATLFIPGLVSNARNAGVMLSNISRDFKTNDEEEKVLQVNSVWYNDYGGVIRLE